MVCSNSPFIKLVPWTPSRGSRRPILSSSMALAWRWRVSPISLGDWRWRTIQTRPHSLGELPSGTPRVPRATTPPLRISTTTLERIMPLNSRRRVPLSSMQKRARAWRSTSMARRRCVSRPLGSWELMRRIRNMSWTSTVKSKPRSIAETVDC